MCLAGAALLGALAPVAACRLNPHVLFNFGPSDHTYLRGFEPEWEIDPDGLATHWSSHSARVLLPAAVAGGPATLQVRAARVYSNTATTTVTVNGAPVDSFAARGGRFVERSIALPDAVSGSGPLVIGFDTAGDEGRNRGLHLDWLRLDAQRLAPTARVVALAAVVSLVFAALALTFVAGRGWQVCAALAVPAALAIYGVVIGPFPLSHLLLRTGWLLIAAPLILLWLGQRAATVEARLAVWLAPVALLLRLGGLFHPLYYYPDLRAHAGLARIIGEVGLDFWRHPAHYIEQQGVWAEAALGKTYAFPFSPVFHAFFAPWASDLLRTMDAMKLAACVISSAEVLIVFAIGRRLGSQRLAIWAAALAVFSPPSFSRLGWAFLAAIFAHFFESLALKTLFDGPLLGRRVAVFAAFLLAGLASYPGSLINFGIFVPLAGAAYLLGREPGIRREGLTLLATSLAVALATIGIVYNEFLRTFLSDMLPRFAAGESRTGTLGAVATLAMIWRRLYAFFGWWYVPVFVAAPLLWWRTPPAPRLWRLLAAWALTFLALVFLRTAAPDLFSRVKEMLWVSPLVALAGGLCLARLEALRAPGRAAAWLGFALLAAYGLAFYGWNIAEKFVLAR